MSLQHWILEILKCTENGIFVGFFKIANPSLFFIHSHLFKQTKQFLQRINVKK